MRIGGIEAIIGGDFTPEKLAEFLRDTDPDLVKRAHLILAQQLPIEQYAAMFPHVYDGQTRLYSKPHIEDVLLPAAIEQSNQGKLRFSYAVLDLDDFSNINLTYGYAAGGDRALEAVADVLKKNLRYNVKGVPSNRRTNSHLDFLAARVGGGEEFGLLLNGLCRVDAHKVVHRIREDIDNMEVYSGDGRLIPVTISGGLVQHEPGMEQELLIDIAGDKLREAKREKGKNTIIVYLPNGCLPQLD